MILDKTDVQILQLLQSDALLTNKELADKLGKLLLPFMKEYAAWRMKAIS